MIIFNDYNNTNDYININIIYLHKPCQVLGIIKLNWSKYHV